MNNSDIIIALIDINTVFISEEHKLLPSFSSALIRHSFYNLSLMHKLCSNERKSGEYSRTYSPNQALIKTVSSGGGVWAG